MSETLNIEQEELLLKCPTCGWEFWGTAERQRIQPECFGCWCTRHEKMGMVLIKDGDFLRMVYVN